jgi:hypothetical protein
MEVLCGQAMTQGASTAVEDLCQQVRLALASKPGKELAILLELVRNVAAPCLAGDAGARPSAKEAVRRVDALLDTHVGAGGKQCGRRRLLQGGKSYRPVLTFLFTQTQ